MYINNEETSHFAPKRKAWDELSINQALLALRTQDLKGVSHQMGVSQHSIRHALGREGISIRAYRRAVAHEKKRVHTRSKSAAFISIHIGNELERPFWVMAAFEHKPANGCSWPIGDLDQGSFKFCGAPRARKKPYCAECAKRAYEPATPLDKKLYSYI